MKRIFALVTVLLSVMAAPAFAISLDAAKAQGIVGERLDGYIGALSSAPNSEAVSLVSTVNAARKEAYAKIAAKNGQPVSVVEKLAAAKLIERLSAGEYFMDKSGDWIKK